MKNFAKHGFLIDSFLEFFQGLHNSYLHIYIKIKSKTLQLGIFEKNLIIKVSF